MRGVALSLFLLLFAACRPAEPQPGAVDHSNPLDRAASEAQLIVDPATTAPVGLYERAHAAGTDAICVAGEAGDGLRFGLVMHFGPTLVCEGRGAATHDGAALLLDFDDADCDVRATYDGQSLTLPGTVDAGCAAVCGPRASISGGAMARVGWSETDAARLRSRRDVVNGRAPRLMCQE